MNVDTCSPDRQLWLYVATTVAQDYAKDGYNYLQSLSSGTDLYTTWFGYYTTGRKNIVQGRFKLINGNQFSTFTYDCTCTKPNTFAYVSAYIFQQQDCYLALNKYFNQSATNLGLSTSAAPSGRLPSPVLIPWEEQSSTKPPTS